MPISSTALRSAVRVIRDEFHRIDGAASGRRDGLLDRGDLQAVATKGDSAELRAAAQVLLTQPDVFASLDVKGPGGRADGLIGRGAINEVLGTPPPRPRAPDRKPVDFKVATWNVENFADAVNDPTRRDEQMTGGRVPSASEVARKTAALAEVLKGISADVVALQEVETRGMLDALADKIDPVRFPPANRVFVDSGTPEGRNVALLTRYPVLSVVNHSREPLNLPPGTPFSDFKHHLLEVTLDVGGQPVVVLVQHQAARADRNGGVDPSRAFREGEAAYARRVADTLRKQDGRRPVIVMGDFNDEPKDNSVKGWLTDGFRGAMDKIPAGSRYTNVYRPEPGVELRRHFDHVLASPDIAGSAKNVWVHQEARRPGVSDHAAVEATFRI